MNGLPGAGKTLLARAMPGVLPELMGKSRWHTKGRVLETVWQPIEDKL